MTRGAKAGENRFNSYIEYKILQRKDMLSALIIDAQRGKLVFNSITSMSKYLAKRFNEITCKSKHISNTTLLRNPVYRAILLKAYNEHSKSIVTITSSTRMLELKLDNNELRKKLLLANETIMNIRSEISDTHHATPINVEHTIKSLDACYKIIILLIEKSNGVFIINDKGIVDQSNLYNNIIVSKKLLDTSNILHYQYDISIHD
ncbi:hypothetical protein RRM51_000440 [Aeromonas veronii]|nr:hypothetical protein [Aeromonas veronii]